MIIKILPKREFDRLFAYHNLSDFEENAFISILDPDNEEKLFLESDNFLQVKMWDIDQKVTNYKGEIFELPSDEELNKIIVFCEKHKDKNFTIHCSAGISRSGAVGKYLNGKYNNEDNHKVFFDMNPHILPNIYIFNRLNQLYAEKYKLKISDNYIIPKHYEDTETLIKELPDYIFVSYIKESDTFALYDILSKEYLNEFNSKSLNETINKYLESLTFKF